MGVAGRKFEGNGINDSQVTYLKLLQAWIFERRPYVNLMFKYPLVCEFSFTLPSSHSLPVATLESEDRQSKES